MTPRLLLGATEPPTVGGSSTASYALFRRMLADGHDVHYAPLIDESDAPYYHLIAAAEGGAPPERVRPCWLRGGLNDPHPELAALISDIDPAVCVGFGFLATVLLTGAAPDRPTAFVTGTCRQAQDHVTSGRARDAVALERALGVGARLPRVVNGAERRAVERASIVITHSTLTLDMMARFFPTWIGKIYPRVVSFAEWIAGEAGAQRHLARPFDSRDIDVLFVASDWGRREKNYGMVRAIVERLPGASVHVIGDVPSEVRGATHHGFVRSREQIFELMGHTRAVVCPSLIDAAPGILYEASVMGCNVVASRNCGNWEICHPALLADPCTSDAFAACLARARATKHADHLDRFLEGRSYRELMKILRALPQPLYAGM